MGEVQSTLKNIMKHRTMALSEKKFVILAREAIDGLKAKDAKTTYKSIKSKKNGIWSSFGEIEKALSSKVALNEKIEELEEEIEDNPEDTSFAKQLNELLSSNSTIALIQDLEIGFSQTPKSLAKISESTVKIKEYSTTNHSKQSKQADPEQSKLESNGNKKSNKINFMETNSASKASKDDRYDHLATYQSVVYGNEQMVLAKDKKFGQKEIGKKPQKKDNGSK